MPLLKVVVSCEHDFMQIVPRITGEETGWRHHLHPRMSRLLQSLGPSASRPAPLLRDVSCLLCWNDFYPAYICLSLTVTE